MPLQETSGNSTQDAYGGGAAAVVNYIENVFSTYLYTGNGGAQIIQNGINLGTGSSGGSGQFTRLSTGYGSMLTTPDNAVLQMGTGNFTIEMWVFEAATVSYQTLYEKGYLSNGGFLLQMATDLKPYIYANGSLLMTSSTAITVGAWTHLAVVRSGSTMTIYLNGVSVASASNSTNFNDANTASIGARNLDNTYPLNGNISNLRVVKGTAVYTANFTPPTSALTAISGTSLLTLQNPSPFIDNSGNNLPLTNVNNTVASVVGPFTSSTAGYGGLVWLKYRSGAASTTYHHLYDSARGKSGNTSYNYIYSNDNGPQGTGAFGPTSFNTNGFSLNDYLNESTIPYVSWTWAKQAKFFDVVTYTGDGVAGRTVAHNLGSVPGCIIVKRTDTSGAWQVYHSSLANTEYLVLNTTAAKATGTTRWNSTTPTSTVFSVGTDATVNASGGTYVAYVFASNAGGFGLTGTDNVITCGSYTGNGSTTGPVVTLGYEPQWVMIKRTDSATNGNWQILDIMRGMSVAGTSDILYANLSGDESPSSTFIIPTATGFQLVNTGTGYNGNGATYIYIAIRRGPMKVPTDATTVFAPVTYSGNSTARTITTNFVTDLTITRSRTEALNTTGSNWVDRLRRKNLFLDSSSTSAEQSASNTITGFDINTGYYLGTDSDTWGFNKTGENYVSWDFQRAPSFFDEVCFTSASGTQNHNLSVAPELVILKSRSTADSWYVFAAQNGFGRLDSTSAWGGLGNGSGLGVNLANVTSTTLSAFSGFLGAGVTSVAYLFATCAGVSKVGTYTGNGTTQAIACGFTGGARFVLIKCTSTTGGWYVYDTARGMTTLTDPYLFLNSTAAEAATLGSVTTTTGGFTVNAAILAAINTSSATYIFLAIA